MVLTEELIEKSVEIEFINSISNSHLGTYDTLTEIREWETPIASTSPPTTWSATTKSGNDSDKDDKGNRKD